MIKDTLDDIRDWNAYRLCAWIIMCGVGGFCLGMLLIDDGEPIPMLLGSMLVPLAFIIASGLRSLLESRKNKTP